VTVAGETAPPQGVWVTATAEVRTTAKWIITVLAAVAAVVFGAGPIVSRPSLDAQDDWGQLLLAGLAGAAGLIGIGILIWAASRVLVPVEMTLATLPAELVAKIGKDSLAYVPSGATSVKEFRRNLRAYRVAVTDLERKVAGARADLEAAREIGDEAAAARAMDLIGSFENARPGIVQRRDMYETTRTTLLERGAYGAVRGIFEDSKPLIITGAVLAGLGGMGFQLLLASSDEENDSAAPPAPVLATLTSIDTPAGTAFWDAVDLASCEQRGAVPVLLRGGTGTQDDPYSVETLPLPGCDPRSFDVLSDVAAVEKPAVQKVTITYTPAGPSPSATRAP